MSEQVERPERVGQWESIKSHFHYLPVHMALLPTGKVIGFGGSGNDPQFLTQPFHAEIWDPDGSADARPIDQNLPSDTFCAGHAFLPDGRLIVAGGTRRYDRQWFGVGFPPFRGLEHTYAFDPFREAWTRLPDMGRGRWYPTLVSLPDGRLLAIAGLSKYFPWYFRRSAEVFSPTEGWRRESKAARWLPLYPGLHLVPGGARGAGRVFYAGSFNTHYTYPFKLKNFPTAFLDLHDWSWRKLSLPRSPQREEASSVLLPLLAPSYRPRVLLLGGGTFRGGQVTPRAEVIDLGAEQPRWVPIPAEMIHARYYCYSVLLPDRRVLVVGGRMGHGEHPHRPPAPSHPHEPTQVPSQDPRAIHETELFDPDSQTWSAMARMQRDRLYHSNALLLPDGRVMVAGSNPARGTNELSIETYRPPYLFRGERPHISDVPAWIRYGEPFELATPQASEISEAALMRPSATTHCVDTEQRYVGLAFRAVSPGVLLAHAPADPCVAPPGHYMVFILRNGVPSMAAFTRLG